MSFPAYGSYKESGVEWLGQVPSHWAVKPIRKMAKLESGHTPSRSKPEYWEDCTVPWFTLADVWQIREGRAHLYDTKEMVSELGLANSSARLLPAGTVVLSRTASVGFSAIMGVPMATTQDFANWICGPTLLPEFLLACLKAMKSEFRRLMMGSTHNTIYMPDIQALIAVAPPLEEQRAIAAFLDRETAKIDALVEAQRRLIELLKEKRQAVISHAVTKGLDPSVPLKDSGVEWLGQVPTHWEVLPIKRVTRTIEQGWSPQCENYPVQGADEWGVLKVGCVNGGRFAPGENKTLPAELEPLPELGIRSGDLLVSRANTRELVGSAAVAEAAHPNLLLCDKLYRLRLDLERCAPAFLALFLGCRVARQQIELAATGASSSMLNIGQAVILELPLALPPLGEQAATLTWLKVELEKLDSLAAKAQALTDVLQERRAALISAAVTGKIDVRDLVAPVQEASAA